MAGTITFVPVIPKEDGLAEGRKIGARKIRQETESLLAGKNLRDTLGAMSRKALTSLVIRRMESPPDYGRYPELEEIYPERIDQLQGLAEGADCSMTEAAVWSYVRYRNDLETWHRSLNDIVSPARPLKDSHCSGVLMVGPKGTLGGQSAETIALEPQPKSYRWHAPPQVVPWRASKPVSPKNLVFRKPRTGYIEQWGTTNEKGVACLCGNSCSVWLDEPIEDTWPIGPLPLLRFAANIEQLAELYTRYTLFNWSRASQIWADTSGKGMVVEKSFRRIGIRWMGQAGALWCTEGHWESPEMAPYIHQKRLTYLEKMGKHLGCGDMQYATDCAVRFTRLGEVCHLPLGRAEKHMARVLSDHAPFPRAVCRHGGPDTAAYDQTVTHASFFSNITRNRGYSRNWIPWKKFPCELPWNVTQYPPVPAK